ncbi:hypothetical protein [Achromobacter pestifer]
MADIRGVLHSSCLIAQEKSREIGTPLADIVEDLARTSTDAPFFSRDGKIVARYRPVEENLEIIDFENFCEIIIPKSKFNYISNIKNGIVPLRFQDLEIKENGRVVLINAIDGISYSLQTLNFSRLRALLNPRG